MAFDNVASVKVWVQAFKGRKFLYLQWHDPHTGERKTETTETADPDVAKKKRGEREYELNHGLYEAQSKLSWEQFREMFEAEYAAGLRERSQEKFTCVFDVFESVAAPKKLRAVNERVLSTFVTALRTRKRRGGGVGLSPITIKNYLIALKTALGWAVQQKLIPALPAFPAVKVPKKKPQPVPSEAFERMLEYAPDAHWRAFLLCGWWAGLRLSEALHLRRACNDKRPWLDLDNDRIILPAEFAKSDIDQWVPLHPTLREALQDLPDTGDEVFPFRSRNGGVSLTRNGVTNRVILIAKRAGVRLSMHRLRM
jgi:integrase